MMNNPVCKICVILISSSSTYWSTQASEMDILKRLYNSQSNLNVLSLPPKVDKFGNESVIVDVNMFIRSVDNLDDWNMELKLQLVLRMKWLDARLKYQRLGAENTEEQSVEYITLKDASKIWIPDIFLANEKQAHEHNIFVPNVYVHLYPNGTVLYSRRISAVLSCPMDLKQFPFDSQICTIRLASYGFTIKQIALQWKTPEPLQIVKSIHLPYFQLENFTTRSSSSRTSSGEYCVLSVDLFFSRIYSYYFNKYFVPVVAVVLISWIPLWLERVLYLRVYIAFSTVIFLGWHYLAQDAGVLVSYTTGIDVWNAANFIFVFVAALESVFVSYMIKTNTNFIKRTHPDDSDEFKMLPFGPDKKRIYEVTDEKTNLDAEILKIKTNFKICFVNVDKEVQIIDAAAKLFFPSSYILFLFFYWIMY